MDGSAVRYFAVPGVEACILTTGRCTEQELVQIPERTSPDSR